MPTYDYKCESCGYLEEVIQKITEEPLKTCPSCKQDTFCRQIGSGALLRFKGSGFYLTDYCKKESPKSSDSGTGSGSCGCTGSHSC